ncbi:hypothetical protein HII36_19250 [Nonomuraea sp. NN258]|uniref:hypothetical protein n=1 Tax=Nonomuraea antri TaxID=2730852 RepID=UPI001568B066|nr:hypothetical protein [Nonomuraea antri]NRQ33971.1 hypothetical protein [Nonomuraea antri]
MTPKQDLADETTETEQDAEEETAEEPAVEEETAEEPAAPEQAEAATDEGTPAGKAGFTRARLLGALAAMLVTAVAATAVLQWVSASRSQDALARLEAERTARLEVAGAAGAFATTLLSYDYQNLQATRSTMAAQATGDFLATYDEAFGGVMTQVIVKLKAVAKTTVREVYVADVDEGLAHAIVVADQQVNTAEAIRSVKDSHLKITLVKEKGVWKVKDVTTLGVAKDEQYKLDGTPLDSSSGESTGKKKE